jgi:protease-4
VTGDGNGPGGSNWERGVLEKLAFAALKEQRKTRRWGIFFKLLGFAYLTFVLMMVVNWPSDDGLTGGKHSALVDLTGVIQTKSAASADNVTAALQGAFKDKNTQGVILRINSPGGSPVQAGIIYDEIRRLRAKYPNVPLYTVVEDICASGGYYVASASDKIFVDKASIVGSIGVIMDQFGFTGTMEKLGVERRVITAGENKAFLDPFSPLRPEDIKHAHELIDEVHRQFIDVVKKGRGDRLKSSPELFSGLVWTGSKSIELGLSDGYGSVDSVARDVIKADQIVDFTRRENFAERIARRFGAVLAEAFGFGADAGAPRLR